MTLWSPNPNKLNTVFGPKNKHQLYGLDNTRSILEWAIHKDSGVIHCIDKNDFDSPKTFGSRLKRLESDGYLVIKHEMVDEYYNVHEMVLTANGEKLLMELREKDPFHSLRTRVSNILWVVVTSMITTLVVLKIKGN
jgi:hypothetical protein